MDNNAVDMKVNKIGLEFLSDKNNIDSISKAIVHYIYRNGPIEDIHVDGCIAENDMKTVNKFMVDRVAGLLSLMEEGQWGKLIALYEFYSHYGTNWDKAKIDVEEAEILYERLKNMSF